MAEDEYERFRQQLAADMAAARRPLTDDELADLMDKVRQLAQTRQPDPELMEWALADLERLKGQRPS